MFTEYSLWFLPLIVLASFLLAFALYKVKTDGIYTKKQKYILFSLRFLGLFFILFLFLSPVRKKIVRTEEKALVIVAQDNSSSLIKTKYKDFYQGKYLKELESVTKELVRYGYRVETLRFGSKTEPFGFGKDDSLKIDYSDYATDYTSLYSYIADNYSSENIAVILLATDGINTVGERAFVIDDKITRPVIPILMGDTTLRKDLKVSDVRYNKIAFLSNEFPVELNIKAEKCKGERTALFMTQGGRTQHVKDIFIDDDNFFQTVALHCQATKKGIEKISFSLRKVENEENVENNIKDIFVEVLDTKKKILILSASAHPDIAALRTVVESKKDYECKTFVGNDIFSADINENYDMVILHNLPYNSASSELVKRIQKTETPMLFIIGQQTNIAYFNDVQQDVKLNSLSQNAVQTLPLLNNNFSSFTLLTSTSELLPELPPLLSPSAKYKVGTNTRILAYQKIGNLATDYPLIAFSERGTNKAGYIFGENIWRWRLHDYFLNNSHNEVDDLIAKSFSLVSDRSDRKKFRLDFKEIYSQNERVVIQAQLYNDNYELVNYPEAKLRLTHGNKTTEYNFGKTSNAYYLNLSSLQDGEYSLTASVNFNGKVLKDDGYFAVSKMSLEDVDLQARHSDLYTLGERTRGSYYSYLDAKDVSHAAFLIAEEGFGKAIIYENTENRRFVTLWWYWLLIATLLSSEWFLRKYWGRL
ncbi:MAG: hypothetical protein IJ748_07585 [Bacteroidales bacterium]|nr:hypothetical protein [Bacteroidales bacterium]